MIAILISNACDPVHLKERSRRIAEIWEKYSYDEISEFENYISMLIEMLQYNLERQNLADILGRLFEKHGHLIKEQELTPQSVADLMSQIVIKPEKQLSNDGFITVYDPTCGSGGTFLSTVQRYMELGYNPVTEMVVLANDINPRAVHMAYIQAAFYGIPAVITQSNVFHLEEATRWYTPAYILGKWVWRCPVSLTTGRSRDDELLKMMTDPMYAAIRWMDGWFMETPPDENS